jgi:4-diphosphocytidyl-2-C-methyl-D-erythritol kinase
MFQLPSFAKVNLALRVIGRRDDGYHELETILQTVSLHDTLHFAANDGIVLECDDPRVPIDDSNLIVKAAKLLAEAVSVGEGARIFLEKRIPFPGGLGGGSSNAAVALIGLSRLWEIDAKADDLHSIAAKIGADVPFFLHGGTALGTGRGDVIEELDDAPLQNILIITPNIDVPTSDIFSRFAADNLTSTASKSILLNYRFQPEERYVFGNDLETTVFAMHPEVGSVKRELLDLGAKAALMSGSGASVFAVFEKEETRQAALKALGQRPDRRKFAVAAISRQQYREALFLT